MNRRSFVHASLASGAGLVVGGGVSEAVAANARPHNQTALRIQRLSWAGIKFETDTHTLLIDAYANAEGFPGRRLGGVVPLGVSTARRYAAVTHLHGDHYDRAALAALFAEDGARGSVVACRSMSTDIASAGLPTWTTDLWTPLMIGPFVLTPVPAVDGFGGEQVSWIVRYEDRRFFHGGDGLWHGRLREYAAQFGPFDTAFLSINGVRSPGDSPPVHAQRTMGPVEAVDAAVALNARRLVPIHYGVHAPGTYEQTEGAEDIVRMEAEARNVQVDWLQAGDWASW